MPSNTTTTRRFVLDDAEPRQPIPTRAAHRINHSSAERRARPLSTVPQLMRSQDGRITEVVPLADRARAKLRRFAHKVKKLFRATPPPTPEEARCPCWMYPPEGWRFCRYDEHVAEGIRNIAVRGREMGGLAW